MGGEREWKRICDGDGDGGRGIKRNCWELEIKAGRDAGRAGKEESLARRKWGFDEEIGKKMVRWIRGKMCGQSGSMEITEIVGWRRERGNVRRNR
jgi:hypothetical protein